MLNSIRDGLPPHSLPIYIIFRNKLPKWPDVFYFYDLSRIRLITDRYLIRPSAFDLSYIRGCRKTFHTLPCQEKGLRAKHTLYIVVMGTLHENESAKVTI